MMRHQDQPGQTALLGTADQLREQLPAEPKPLIIITDQNRGFGVLRPIGQAGKPRNGNDLIAVTGGQCRFALRINPGEPDCGAAHQLG